MAQELRTNRFPQLVGGLQVVPNVDTDVTTRQSWIEQVTVANTTAGAVTFTMKDKQTSPLKLFAAVSIPANTTFSAVFPKPVKMLGGITWSAGTVNALHAEIVGYQVGV